MGRESHIIDTELAYTSFSEEIQLSLDEPLIPNQEQEQEQEQEQDESLSEVLTPLSESDGELSGNLDSRQHHWIWLFLNHYTRRYYRCILLFWLAIVWPVGLYSLPRLMKRADSTFQPIPGTRSAIALEKYTQAYSKNVPETLEKSSLHNASHSHDPHFKPIIVLFQLEQENSANTSGNSSGHDSLIDANSPHFNATKDYIHRYTNYLQSHFPHQKLSMESFYHLYAEFPVLAKHSLASLDGSLVLLKINPPSNKLSKTELFSFLDTITSYPKTAIPPEGVNISYTGLTLFQQDMIASSKKDISSLDTISLPISLLILGYVLGSSIPILILPMITIFSTICLWSTILYFIMVTTNITIAQFTPSIMMSLTIAMSVDYSLFYLSRIIEEIQMHTTEATNASHTTQTSEVSRDKKLLRKANLCALSTAGHSILVSGSTLAMCLIGLTILPLDMMVSTGIGSSIAVISCILINLTVLPSMMHTEIGLKLVFYHGHSCLQNLKIQRSHGMTIINSLRKRLRILLYKEFPLDNINDVDIDNTSFLLRNDLGLEFEKMTELDSVKSDEYSYETVDDLTKVDSHIAIHCTRSKVQLHTQQQQMHLRNDSSFWMRMGQYILRNKKRSKTILSILVFCFILPVSYFLFQLKTSIAMELMVPYNSPALTSYQRLGESFGKGALSPYQIVFDGRLANKTIDSSEGFHFMQNVLRNLTNEDTVIDKSFGEKLSNADKRQFSSSLMEKETFFSLQSIYSSKIHPRENTFIKNTFVDFPDLIIEFIQEQLFDETPSMKNTKTDTIREAFPATPTLSSYTGIPSLNGTLIPYYVYEAAIMCHEIASTVYHTNCPIPSFHALAFIANKTCSESHQTTSVTAILEVDPFTSNGVEWLTSARSVLENITSHEKQFDVYIIGGAAIENDAIYAIFASFPKMIAMTTLIVFTFMGISFQSLGVPIRSVLSIGSTLSFVYGLAVLVYQYGLLDWMHLRCFNKVGAISFVPPIMAFTVVVGLGLDYDVFLSTRILEYRKLGYSNTSSILLGLEKTGRIITAAGVIMCVAFGGLLFSDSIMLNQFSFFLVSAVMLDTFIIRTILVPIVLDLCGDHWGWWPRKFPISFKSIIS